MHDCVARTRPAPTERVLRSPCSATATKLPSGCDRWSMRRHGTCTVPFRKRCHCHGLKLSLADNAWTHDTSGTVHVLLDFFHPWDLVQDTVLIEGAVDCLRWCYVLSQLHQRTVQSLCSKVPRGCMLGSSEGAMEDQKQSEIRISFGWCYMGAMLELDGGDASGMACKTTLIVSAWTTCC